MLSLSRALNSILLKSLAGPCCPLQLDKILDGCSWRALLLLVLAATQAKTAAGNAVSSGTNNQTGEVQPRPFAFVKKSFRNVS